jgi:probable O-glycosylation ligase (exosortase A-associated)
MGLYWVWKTPYKLRFILGGLVVVSVAGILFPDKWYGQMESIQNYEQDQSAMGRIQAWQFTLQLVAARPIVGGGFEPYTRETYDRYAPAISSRASRPQGPHSIYFKPLGEHGIPGLILFLSLGIVAMRRCTQVIRETRGRHDLAWAHHMAAMIQVALVGFATSGAFLGMTYFDLYYHFLAILVVLPLVLRPLLHEEVAEPSGERETPASPGIGGLR